MSRSPSYQVQWSMYLKAALNIVLLFFPLEIFSPCKMEILFYQFSSCLIVIPACLLSSPSTPWLFNVRKPQVSVLGLLSTLLALVAWSCVMALITTYLFSAPTFLQSGPLPWTPDSSMHLSTGRLILTFHRYCSTRCIQHGTPDLPPSH